MSHQILIVSGSEVGRVFPLMDGQRLAIGRGQQSDTKIDDPYMSRVHCFVSYDGGVVQLADGGGVNTLVRGVAVESCNLKPGDEFQAGNTVFRYVIGDPQDESTVRISPQSKVKPVAPPSHVPSMTELVGHTYVHYRIDSVLATGSTGIVFRGTDTEKERPVAIKVLFPDRTSNEEEKDRFIRAMKTMLPIRHPNIVRLINAGKSGPFCWAVMEFVDGDDLTDIIKRIGIEGMLDWREVWRAAVDIAGALQAAYEHKVIHRNVSPKNILRRTSDKVCLLGDLMLAKALEGTNAIAVTSPGNLIGDLAYMPPERTRDGVPVDCRSDIYGLGATLYALLTGRPPFHSNSTTEMIRLVREGVPESPKKFQLSINDEFVKVVMKMIEKRPEDRFQNPAALMKDLDRVGKFQGLVS